MVAGFIIVLMIALLFFINAWYELGQSIKEIEKELDIHYGYNGGIHSRKLDRYKDELEHTRSKLETARNNERYYRNYAENMQAKYCRCIDNDGKIEDLLKYIDHLEKLLLDHTDLGEM